MQSEATTVSLTEASRRWDDFHGGRPVLLPDGSVWYFYEPEATLRVSDDRRSLVPAWSFGPDVHPGVGRTLSDRFNRVLAKCARATTDADRASAAAEAAWFLLARNYRLTAHEFEAILLRSKDLPLNDQIAIGEALGTLITDVVSREAEVA